MLVIRLKIPDAQLGEQAIALEHFGDRPLQRARRLFGIGHDGDVQVRDAVIHSELDHLGVYHDELHVIGIGLIQQAYDERVHAHGFAGARRSRDEQMRQLRDISDNGLARDILADGKGELGLGRRKLFRVDDIPQVHGAYELIRHLDADGRYFIGYGRYSNADNAQCKRYIPREICQLAELNALLKLHVIAGDGGAVGRIDYTRIHAEALDGAFKAFAVRAQLLIGVGGGGMALLEQEYGGLFVLAVLGSGFDLARDRLSLGGDLRGGGLPRRVGHGARLHGTAPAQSHGSHAGYRLGLLDGYGLNIPGMYLGRLFAEGPALFCGLAYRGLAFAAPFFAEGGLVVHWDVYGSALCGFCARLFILVGLLKGFCPAFGLGLFLLLRLISCRLTAAEPLNNVTDAYIERRQGKKHKSEEQYNCSAVNAEGLLEHECQQTADNAAALHGYAAAVQGLEHRAETVDVFNDNVGQQYIRKRAHHHREQQRRGRSPCNGSALVEAEYHRGQYEHRCAYPEAVAEQSLEKRAEPAHHEAVVGEHAYYHEHGRKHKAYRRDLAPYGSRLRCGGSGFCLSAGLCRARSFRIGFFLV